MKVEEIHSPERRLLTALITDASVLRAAAPFVKGKGLTRWAELVAGWCVSHLETHGTAPGRAIEHYWSKYARTRAGKGDEESAKFVGDFLTLLSGDYEALEGRGASAKEAEECLAEANLRKHHADMAAMIECGDYAAAEKLRRDFRPVEFGATGDFFSIVDCRAAIERSLSGENDVNNPPLLSFHGALGSFYRRALDRACFVAYNAPEKRGKSTVLLDLAWRAMTQRRRVAYFEAGDMTEHQWIRRLCCRAAGRPLFPGHYEVPVFASFLRNGDEVEFDVRRESRYCGEAMTVEEAHASVRDQHAKWCGKNFGCNFRMRKFLGGQLTVQTIDSTLRAWADTGWQCDVLVIDYADLLAPVSAPQWNEREGINDTWKRLRALTQQMNLLCLTATQCKTSAGGKKRIDVTDIGADDRRKNAHATSMYAIDQTDREKKAGVARLNDLLNRDDSAPGTLYMAQCLPIYNPCARVALYQ